MTVKMTDFDEWDWSPGARGYLSMHEWRGAYREGVYRHPAGLVEVYECLGDKGYLSLRLRWKGRDYCRSWKTVWGDKTIARLAREFIEEKMGR
jgi:hypothetical protein